MQYLQSLLWAMFGDIIVSWNQGIKRSSSDTNISTEKCINSTSICHVLMTSFDTSFDSKDMLLRPWLFHDDQLTSGHLDGGTFSSFFKDRIYIRHALMIFQMWNDAWNKLQFKICHTARGSVAYLDKHSTLDPVMVSAVISIPTVGNFLKLFKPPDVNFGLKCKCMWSYREKLVCGNHKALRWPFPEH